MTGSNAVADSAAAPKPMSPNARSWARFKRHRLGYRSLWLFIALLLDDEGIVLGPDEDNHVVINHIGVSDTNITLLRVGPQ